MVDIVLVVPAPVVPRVNYEIARASKYAAESPTTKHTASTITIVATTNKITECGAVFQVCLKDARQNHSVATVQASAHTITRQ